MKKNLIFSLIVALFVFSSCEKDEISVQSNQSATTQKLLEFKKVITSRSTTTIQIDSALWMMEGLINLENANNNHMIEDVMFKSDTIYIAAENNNITTNELLSMYQNLSAMINSVIPNGEIVDVVNLEMNNILSTDLKIAIVVNISYGIAAEEQKAALTTIGSTDYWYAVFESGKCDIYAGQYIGQDATNKLQSVFNTPSQARKDYYYTSIVEVTAFPYDYPESNAWGSYMIWVGENNDCLSPTALDYYVCKFSYIRDLNCPPGKEFVNSTVDYTIVVGPTTKLHFYTIRYGTRTY